MASFLPSIFSGTPAGGASVLISDAAIDSGTIVHTASASGVDEIWIWAQNNGVANIELTVGFGGTAVKDCITCIIPMKSGLFLLVPGLRLTSSAVVRARAATANVVSLFVNVNRYTA